MAGKSADCAVLDCRGATAVSCRNFFDRRIAMVVARLVVTHFTQKKRPALLAWCHFCMRHNGRFPAATCCYVPWV